MCRKHNAWDTSTQQRLILATCDSYIFVPLTMKLKEVDDYFETRIYCILLNKLFTNLLIWI